MPAKKGRRNPRERRRSRSAPADRPDVIGDGVMPAPARDNARHDPARPTRPPMRARYAGFALGVVTLFIALLTLADVIVGGYDLVNAGIRLATGVGLLVIALALGALSLAPDAVRRLLFRDSR